MDSLTREERKSIVENELYLLREGNYISFKTYEHVVKAHEKFYRDQHAKEDKFINSTIIEEPEIIKPVAQKKVKEPKKRSPEQIRERNITWLLNLGVILLLFGGLFVATSNWVIMTNWMKAGSIALISLLFYGMAVVSGRLLRIEKTAFAFTILGSLFLPIFLLSIGWFQLLGTYFSVFGEGRYLFGVFSSIVVLPVYIYLARRQSSRLFVWFSYLSLTLCIGFLLASFQAGIDFFYLGMMVYNSLLIVAFRRLKEKQSFQLFSKEFHVFVQCNLILATLLMLIFFESHIYFGFNLLLTAAIYLSMVYVTGKKEFHFVFTAMVVYGVYQLVEFSVLDNLGPILYASIAFMFLLFPKYLDDQYPWKKIFTATSGVISGLAFLYISLEGLILKLGDPSIVLLLAYFIIAGNFLYLSNTTKRLLFIYLTPIFLSAGLFEGVLLLDKWLIIKSAILLVFMIGFLLFVFGAVKKWPAFYVIRKSSRDIGWVYMLLTSMSAIVILAWWELGIMLLLIGVCAMITLKVEDRELLKLAGQWIFPVAVGFAFAAFGEEVRRVSYFYEYELGIPVHFIFGSVVLLVGMLQVKDSAIKRNSLYVSQVFYSIGLFYSFVFPINDEVVRPLIASGAIVMYAKLYHYTKMKWVPYLISSAALIAYFTLLYSIHLLVRDVQYFELFQWILAAVLLLASALYFQKRDRKMFTAFAITGHAYMPFSLLFTLVLNGEESAWTFLVGILVYAFSTNAATSEWKKKLFLYSTFTTVFLAFATGFHLLKFTDGEYPYLFTSLAIAVFWFLVNEDYKKRTAFYFVPFSLVGVIAFLTVYPYGTISFMLTILYCIGVMIFIHRAKWDIIAVVPILFMYFGCLQFMIYHELGVLLEHLLLAGFGLSLLITGKVVYKQLYGEDHSFIKRYLDFYSISSVIFFITMYALEQPVLWMKLLPGLFIVLVFWLQRKRVHDSSRWIPTFLAGGYLLQPYYTLLEEVSIPSLLETEMLVLPFVALGIYLRFCLKGKYGWITSRLQWAILTIVSIMLVMDGLESSTVYDAIILGTLSLVSILAGVFFKIKAYFFIGSGVLLLNVLLQTRPFWGNLPWWAYLLIAGSLLIIVASYNEYHKLKVGKGEVTLLGKVRSKIIAALKKWN
ncbi:hypothetical protein [Bacillus dakarensis]|uniref:hypothetical protein n=1 Tax=Robertmurraya dakarensis TaxID=1926278 RepID=UPI00098130B5|nr:hypothetical protein [Bacillus dakarensis]